MENRTQLRTQLKAYFADWTIEGDNTLSAIAAIESQFDTLFPDEHHVQEMLRLLSAPESDRIKGAVIKNIVSNSFIVANGHVHIGDKKTIVFNTLSRSSLNRYRTLGKPPRTAFLLKRRAVLAAIHIALEDKKRVILRGRSGIGKSVLAENYYHEYGNNYDYLMWIPYQTDLPNSYIVSRDSSQIELAHLIAECRAFDLPLPEINRRCAVHIAKVWSDMAGQKLLILDGVTDVEDVISFQNLFDMDDCRVLITAQHGAEGDFSYFDVPKLTQTDIETLAQALSDTEHWNKNDLNHIAENALLLDLTLRHCPRDNPKASETYLRTLHPIAQKSDWETALLAWLIEAARLSAGQRWSLVQWAALPDNRAIELETMSRIVGLEGKTLFHSPDFHLFKGHADKQRYTRDTEPTKDLETLHAHLAEEGWLIHNDDDTYLLHPFLRTYFIATYGIAWDYVAAQMQSLETHFFIKEEVGYDDADDDQTQKCQLIYEAHIAHFLAVLKSENTEGYRSLVSKYVAVLQAEYMVELLTEWLEKQLDLWEKAKGEDDTKTCEKRHELGSYYHNIAEYGEALKLYEHNLPLWRMMRHHQAEGMTLNNIGQIYTAQGDYNTALRYLEQSLAITQQIGDCSGDSLILNNISQIYDAQGDYDTALLYLEKSLEITQQISDRQGEGRALNNISQIYITLGNYDTALCYLEQSLVIKQQIGDRKGEGSVLNNISQIYKARGDYGIALPYLEQSLTITQQIGDRPGEGSVLNNISQIYQERGDYDTALRYLEQSLAIQQQIGDRKGEGTTLNNISQIYQERGDYDIALCYLEQSLAIQRQIGDKAGLATTLSNMGAIYWNQQEDAANAVVCFIHAYQIKQRIGISTSNTEEWLNTIIGEIGEAVFEAILAAQEGQ